MAKRISHIGRKFGRLTVIRDAEDYFQPNGKIVRKVLCKCDCWKEKIFCLSSLTSLRSKSCWCINIERSSTHWMKNSRIYKIYHAMRSRCHCASAGNFFRYWERWIHVCKSWRNCFEKFYKDMWNEYEEHVKKHWEKQTSIDRIDNSKWYSKDNCRWVTLKEQGRNKTNNRIITFKWKSMTIAGWADSLWLKYNTLNERIRRWYSLEKALTSKLWKYVKT